MITGRVCFIRTQELAMRAYMMGINSDNLLHVHIDLLVVCITKMFEKLFFANWKSEVRIALVEGLEEQMK